MIPKRLPDVIIAACVVALAAWWFWPAKKVPEKPTVHSHPATQFAETSPAPNEAPPEPSPIPVVAAVEIQAPAIVDPQAELSTAIPDIIRLVQAGDFSTFFDLYMPPEEVAGKLRESKEADIREMQKPENQRELQQAIWELQAVQFTPPTYDATGNRATYTPPDGSAKIDFIKENGRWYLN